LLGSNKQNGHIIVPQPMQVLLNLLQPQCLQSLKEEVHYYYYTQDAIYEICLLYIK